MSGKLAIMAGLAVVFGATSYYAGNQYLDSQAKARLNEIENSQASIEVAQVVVATDELRFGDTLAADKLKLVTWPKESMPEGAFTSVEEAVGEGQRKVLKAVAKNEPLLDVKLSGEDGRAGLSGIIAEGMRAVTIPVDTVKGVGGFVQPGDRVDIVFSQRDQRSGQQTAKIIMEKVKVLTVDQEADNVGSPKVAKTVTLETDTEGAQRLALAAEVGRLSLLLRGVGDEASVEKSVVSFGESPNRGEENADGAPDSAADQPNGNFLSFLNKEKTSRTIRVVRGDEVREATVPVLKQLKKQKIN